VIADPWFPRRIAPAGLAAALLLTLTSGHPAALAQTAEETPTTAADAPASSPSSAALTFTIVPESSEARYRVREQLVGLSLPSDAVGTTRKVTGQIVVDASGAILREQSQIVVDLSTLQSDQSRRDRFIKGNTLETDRYPTAVFVPAEAPGFPPAVPTSGEFSFQLVGDLTIRDVTRPVTWDATASFTEQEVKGSATTAITFADFNMTQPRVGPVLSIEDPIRLELDFTFRRGEAAAPAALAPAKLNLNTATPEEFLSIPGVGDRMVREFLEYRPYVSIQQFRREIGKYVSEEQVAAYEQYVYVPVDPNQADAETLQQLPGVDATIAADLIAARPYDSAEAFLARLTEYLPAEQVAAAQAYLATP